LSSRCAEASSSSSRSIKRFVTREIPSEAYIREPSAV
jgi:hypothetical protein